MGVLVIVSICGPAEGANQLICILVAGAVGAHSFRLIYISFILIFHFYWRTALMNNDELDANANWRAGHHRRDATPSAGDPK